MTVLLKVPCREISGVLVGSCLREQATRRLVPTSVRTTSAIHGIRWLLRFFCLRQGCHRPDLARLDPLFVLVIFDFGLVVSAYDRPLYHKSSKNTRIARVIDRATSFIQ